jgi:copper chaperone
MNNKIYTIKDMHCAACVMRIEGIEDDLPGIHKISASYHKQQLQIQFDESQVSESQIIAAVLKLGYHIDTIIK